MNIKFNNQDLYINDKLYDTAETIVQFILKSLQAKTMANNQKQLFYATLIAFYANTGYLLKNMDTEDVDFLMKVWDLNNKELLRDEEK